MRRTIGLSALAFSALATLAACGGSSSPPSAEAADADAGTATDDAKAPPTGDDAGATPDPGSDFVCDPPAPAGSLYALSDVEVGATAQTSMCAYRGEVLLVFNAAQLCGFTPQTTALQKLQKTYAARGFTVLGFYSDDFANQGGDPAACNAHFGVTFDTFDLAPVRGAAARPVFAWLAAQENPGPAPALVPEWNFSKYLVDRGGHLVAHWDHTVTPDAAEITTAIEAELAKP